MIVWEFPELCWFYGSDLILPCRWRVDTLRSFRRGRSRSPRCPFWSHSTHRSWDTLVLGTIWWRCTKCKAVWSRCLTMREVTFAGAKVCKLDAFSRNEYILGLDIPMEDSFAVNILDWFEKLIHVGFDLVMVEVLIPDKALIKVLLHQLED